MNDEKMRILKMLEEEKISAQEAVRLMECLGESGEPKAAKKERTEDQDDEHFEEEASHSWVDDIRGAAMEIGRSVREAIDDESGVFNFDFDWFTSTEKINETYFENFRDADIHTLIIDCYNAPIKVVTNESDSSDVVFEITAGARSSGKHRNRSRKFEFAAQGGIMRLVYDEKAFKYIGIKINIPKITKLSAIVLKTRNGAITVNDLAVGSLEAITKNGAVKIDGCAGQRLTCETKNGGITLREVEMADISAVTKNAKIILDNISGRECECFISAETKNASIKAKLLNEGRALKVSAATSNSSIISDIKDLVYYTKEKTRVEAMSVGYENADYKMDLTLKSANGKIQVK